MYTDIKSSNTFKVEYQLISKALYFSLALYLNRTSLHYAVVQLSSCSLRCAPLIYSRPWLLANDLRDYTNRKN